MMVRRFHFLDWLTLAAILALAFMSLVLVSMPLFAQLFAGFLLMGL